MTNNNLGLYLHIPFCDRKCSYCDFYSTFPTEEVLNLYITRLVDAVKKWGGETHRPIDTIYLGGGTPSIIGSRIIPLMEAVYDSFAVTKNAEITMELNPAQNVNEVLLAAKTVGINRLSIGAQTGNDNELKVLGRRHTSLQTSQAVNIARKIGFDNISLDIMIALPDSNINTLKRSIDFVTGLKPEHISSYILKIEENTLFYKRKNNYNFLNDDLQAEQYLYLCSELENSGFNHYEISNFCRKGKESRHNLKYWRGEEYIGIGPSAHSFFDGKRFYYDRDLKGFIKGIEPVLDSNGGGIEEYIMLRLRLKDGISLSYINENYDNKFFNKLMEKLRLFGKSELAELTDDRFYLTDKGMLVSNSVITEILECI